MTLAGTERLQVVAATLEAFATVYNSKNAFSKMFEKITYYTFSLFMVLDPCTPDLMIRYPIWKKNFLSINEHGTSTDEAVRRLRSSRFEYK